MCLNYAHFEHDIGKFTHPQAQRINKSKREDIA